MKIVESSVKLIPQMPGIEGVYKQIEFAGRTAYKSLDKIKYDENGMSTTAADFVQMLINLGHYSPLEHGTINLYVHGTNPEYDDIIERYKNNAHSIVDRVSYDTGEFVNITTNYRVILENNWFSDLKFLHTRPYNIPNRFTVRIVCDRGISHEFVRHRTFSFLMESQRYCNYNNDKFNNQVVFVKPSELPVNTGVYEDSGDILHGDGTIINRNDYTTPMRSYLNAMCNAENAYMSMIKTGVKPEIARCVLPNSTKTELIMTGTKGEWEEFFKLRCSDKAHPDARLLANKIKKLINDYEQGTIN